MKYLINEGNCHELDCIQQIKKSACGKRLLACGYHARFFQLNRCQFFGESAWRAVDFTRTRLFARPTYL